MGANEPVSLHLIRGFSPATGTRICALWDIFHSGGYGQSPSKLIRPHPSARLELDPTAYSVAGGRESIRTQRSCEARRRPNGGRVEARRPDLVH